MLISSCHYGLHSRHDLRCRSTIEQCGFLLLFTTTSVAKPLNKQQPLRITALHKAYQAVLDCIQAYWRSHEAHPDNPDFDEKVQSAILNDFRLKEAMPTKAAQPVFPPAAESSQSITHEAQLNGVVFPPGDLYSNEPPLESYLHLQQMILLLNCLDWLWKDRTDYFSAGNLTVYYSPRQRKSEDFRGPDFFVVLGIEKRSRKSWVVREEDGKYPNIIVELLSDSTAKTDRGLKKQIYQDIFRTPDYFWFDPASLELKGFHLVDGVYQQLQPNPQGHL